MTTRGFTLIEAMISAAMVGILGAGALSLVTHVTTQSGEERLRALAVADATATVERLTQLVSVASTHGGAIRFCELVEGAGGPLSGGDAPVGVCPERSAANIPIAGARLRRAVTLSAVDIDGVQGFRIVVTITGVSLRRPVVFSTILPISGVAT